MTKNLFSDIPVELEDEFIEPILKKPEVNINRIVSRGHSSPQDFWYNQNKDEFVLLLQGEAKLEFKNEKDTIYMNKGDYIIIPAHKEHRVEWTSPDEDTIWLAVYYE